jgi:glyceraldehyde 3-phosphate dehydrogenase
MNMKVGIAGLGRIGRGILRANYAPGSLNRFDICVVCDVMPIDHVAYLLAHDSTYGRPSFTVAWEGDDLILDNKRVAYQRVDRRRSDPDEDSFGMLRDYRLDVLIDATGTASIEDFRALIRQQVAKKILCTWNVPGSDISLVFGINHKEYQPDIHHVISTNTCTGNALVPVFHVLDQHFGIEYARIITIHPALSDQRMLDGYHASSQLGRASAVSIVPTATAVAKSTVLVLPNLAGKLDALSYRVPTTIVSVIDISVRLSRDTCQDEVIKLLASQAEKQLQGIINCDYGVWGHQKTSIDYMGAEFSAIILMKHVSLCQQRQLGMSLMHDNEHGYCCRVLDILGFLAITQS